MLSLMNSKQCSQVKCVSLDLTVFLHILQFGVHKPGPGFNSMSPDKIGLYVVMPLEQD